KGWARAGTAGRRPPAASARDREQGETKPLVRDVAPVAAGLPNPGPSEKIELALAEEPALQGFLPTARARLIAATDKMTADVGIRAVEIARKRHATAVDLQDVNDSHEELLGNKSAQMKSFFMGIAGILLGAAIATGVAVGLMEPGPAHENFWWAGVAIVGVAGAITMYKALPKWN
ncbi:hypothetical protein, partial [Rhodococcus qingshengii]|uniref:hypothetical protein n=1 Tax=Rhodococcus qingshengii TaxID=334542 RepID=UPI002AFE14E9